MTLEERVKRLERQNRRLRVLSIVFGVFLLCAVSMGASLLQTDVVSTNKMQIIGSNGRVRARLDVDANGIVRFQCLDANGRHRIGVGCEANGKAGVNTFDAGGNVVKSF